MTPLLLSLLSLAFLLLSLPGPARSSLSPPVAPATFAEFVAQYGKRYASDTERAHREAVFLSNVALVARLNAEQQGRGAGAVVYALNGFADLSEAEFRRTVLLPRRPSPAFARGRYAPRIASSTALPDALDWRNHSAVTPVRDQGSVGTCWAFSAVGAIESQRALLGRGLQWLAVEQVADCDNTTDPASLHADCGVFGGWPYLAYQYVSQVGGLQSEESYPYCSGTGQCYPCPAPGWNETRCGPPVEYCLKNESCAARFRPEDIVPGSRVAGWQAVAQDEDEMAAQLAQRGPLSILIDASGLQFYKSGVWAPKFCSKKDTDHAVLLVGYGSEGGNPYWIVKNSWGVKWGDQGYFRLQRGHNMCAVNTGVTFPQLA